MKIPMVVAGQVTRFFSWRRKAFDVDWGRKWHL